MGAAEFNIAGYRYHARENPNLAESISRCGPTILSFETTAEGSGPEIEAAKEGCRPDNERK
jgi:hypothetical protein